MKWARTKIEKQKKTINEKANDFSTQCCLDHILPLLLYTPSLPIIKSSRMRYISISLFIFIIMEIYHHFQHSWMAKNWYFKCNRLHISRIIHLLCTLKTWKSNEIRVCCVHKHKKITFLMATLNRWFYFLMRTFNWWMI